MHWVTQYGTDRYAGLSYYDAAHYSTLKLVKNRIGFKEDFSLLITSLCQSLHQYWRSSSFGSRPNWGGSSRTSSHQLHRQSPVKQFKIETDGRRKWNLDDAKVAQGILARHLSPASRSLKGLLGFYALPGMMGWSPAGGGQASWWK